MRFYEKQKRTDDYGGALFIMLTAIKLFVTFERNSSIVICI